jgi:hypothetical protein
MFWLRRNLCRLNGFSESMWREIIALRAYVVSPLVVHLVCMESLECGLLQCFSDFCR